MWVLPMFRTAASYCRLHGWFLCPARQSNPVPDRTSDTCEHTRLCWYAHMHSACSDNGVLQFDLYDFMRWFVFETRLPQHALDVDAATASRRG